MTVDEYLNQIRTARRKCKSLGDKLMRDEVQAHDVRSPSNMGDGVRQGYRGENSHETKLLKFADTAKKYRESSKLYEDTRDSVRSAIEMLPYWAGCLIHHVYLYNAVFDEEDDLKGADEIVGTKDRRIILSQLSEAKVMLADALRAQGVPIE